MTVCADELGLIDVFNDLSKLVIIEKALWHTCVIKCHPSMEKMKKIQDWTQMTFYKCVVWTTERTN